MEIINDKPNNKIITSVDAHNYLIQNIELKSLKKIDCFLTIYLNENNEVLYIKTIEKKKTDSDIEIVGQILDFDKNLNVDSLIVCHKPIKSKGIDPEKQIANMLIDRAFFSFVNVLDYQWLFNEKYYHSMFEHKNVAFRKHSFNQKRTIKQNEQYTSCTNLQELFDMDIDKLENIIKLEYDKISCADGLLVWEIIDIDLYGYMELRFRSVLPWELNLPRTKMYLVGIFKEYMKAKDRIMEFINKSNLYDKYLLFRFDYKEYHNVRNAEKAKRQECHNTSLNSINHLQIVR